jgi:tryptophan-rich sensory protein
MPARYGSLTVLLLMVVGAALLAGSFEAGEWYYQKLSKPSWTPPGAALGVGWAVAWLTQALAAWQLWQSGHYARLGALAWWAAAAGADRLVGLFFGINRIGWAWLDGLALPSPCSASACFIPYRDSHLAVAAWPVMAAVPLAAQPGDVEHQRRAAGRLAGPNIVRDCNARIARRAPTFRAEHVQLVAVEVAEVAGVETVEARPGRAFVLCAQRDGLVVDLVHHVFRSDRQRDHHAIADGGSLAIVGFRDRDRRFVRGDRPGDEVPGIFHEALGAQNGEQFIVESGGARQIVGAECYVSDHARSPSS